MYVHVRTIAKRSATLLVPCIGSELQMAPGAKAPRAPEGARFSVLIFQPARDGPPSESSAVPSAPQTSTAKPSPDAGAVTASDNARNGAAVAAPEVGGLAVDEAASDLAPAASDTDKVAATPDSAADGDTTPGAPPTAAAAAADGAVAVAATSGTATLKVPALQLDGGTTLDRDAAHAALRLAAAVYKNVGLHNDAEAEFAARLKADLTTAAPTVLGALGTWHVIFAASTSRSMADPGARGAEDPTPWRSPGFSIPGGGSAVILEFSATPFSAGCGSVASLLSPRSLSLTPARYSVCAFMTHAVTVAADGTATTRPASEADDDEDDTLASTCGRLATHGVMPTMARAWRRDRWSVGRVALYAISIFCFGAYVAAVVGQDTTCARTRPVLLNVQARRDGGDTGLGAAGAPVHEDEFAPHPAVDAAATGFVPLLPPTPPPPRAALRAVSDSVVVAVARVVAAARSLIRRLERQGGISSTDDSVQQHEDSLGPVPPGCSLADAEAAEARQRRGQALLYGGMVALGLLSLMRIVQRSSEAARLQGLLRSMPAALAAARSLGGTLAVPAASAAASASKGGQASRSDRSSKKGGGKGGSSNKSKLS